MRTRDLLIGCLTMWAALVAVPAYAATLLFNSVPFAGTTALTTPGRQIITVEPSLVFNPAVDVLAFDTTAFLDLGGLLTFANGPAATLPTSGINVIVLQEFGPPMNAGLAANLIAARITSPGAGLFIYFNTGLGVPRLVYSTDLGDETADLHVLARFTNLNAQSLATMSASNFQVVTTPVPEPGTLVLLATAGLLVVGRRFVRVRR